MEQKITLNKIQSFIEGYKNFFLLKLNLKSDSFKEQVAYRMTVCENDCMKQGKCIYCQCSVPEKMMTIKSCNNGLRFPNIMEEDKWNKYKEDNNIS